MLRRMASISCTLLASSSSSWGLSRLRCWPAIVRMYHATDVSVPEVSVLNVPSAALGMPAPLRADGTVAVRTALRLRPLRFLGGAGSAAALTEVATDSPASTSATAVIIIFGAAAELGGSGVGRSSGGEGTGAIACSGLVRLVLGEPRGAQGNPQRYGDTVAGSAKARLQIATALMMRTWRFLRSQ